MVWCLHVNVQHMLLLPSAKFHETIMEEETHQQIELIEGKGNMEGEGTRMAYRPHFGVLSHGETVT